MRRFAPLFVAVQVLSLAFLPATLFSSPADAARVPYAAAGAPCAPGSGVKLRGRDLTQGSTLPAVLRCADLTGAKLDGVDLTARDLTGAVLRKASLKEADLGQAHLDYADLRGADLSDADLGQLRARKADLRGAILTDADAVQAEFPHADLTGAVLTRAVLTQADLTDATLVGADLRDATLGQIKARKADLTRAKLGEAKLGQAHLEHAVLRNADLSEAEFTQAELDGADFRGADVGKASFIQASDVNLTGARGTPVNLPDDAVAPGRTDGADGEGDAQVGVDDVVRGDTGDDLTVRAGGTRGPSPALILVVVSGLGLVLTLIMWGGAHRRKQRFAAEMAVARHAAEEDVTRFGEEIDALDFEMKINQISGPSQEWRAALDAYEAAKQALGVARTPYELRAAAVTVARGRDALRQVRSRLPNTGGSR
ncbi:pentapeptide repeat-containing protein [Microbispora amethystogenes]|uniref:Pentapeptide repeat-containing protein n=1 Tax=Microbispora amethystogenes TaxID=1427754 RepID=A0ABQ4F786_9ACTN|nr:pentapeptide repeat-containing protein [Microbispora amethystogenes]GIH30671.1 hypothetical protein Mam01_08350 [Microbispora amethystogenes]